MFLHEQPYRKTTQQMYGVNLFGASITINQQSNDYMKGFQVSFSALLWSHCHLTFQLFLLLEVNHLKAPAGCWPNPISNFYRIFKWYPAPQSRVTRGGD